MVRQGTFIVVSAFLRLCLLRRTDAFLLPSVRRGYASEMATYTSRTAEARLPAVSNPSARTSPCAVTRMSGEGSRTMEEEKGGGQTTRLGWLQQQAVTTAAFVVGAGVISSSPVMLGAAPAVAAGGGGLPASGYFVQHAVFKVTDMDAEVTFFTEGLGMKVVRQREVDGVRNVFVAYGPESLAGRDGGYFSLELVYDPKAPRSFASGGAFEYLGMTLPSTLATVAYKTDAAGGTVVPHWFAQTNYVEVCSPAGVTVRVREGKRRDPFAVVAFGTANENAARDYFHDVLGMKEQSSGLLKILGPLAGDSNRLSGYDPDGVSVALNPTEIKPRSGGMFDKLAILAKDTKALADRVSGSGGTNKFGGDVLFAGEVPGIGTKVANTVDFEGRGVVFVDYDDFEKEMAPSA